MTDGMKIGLIFLGGVAAVAAVVVIVRAATPAAPEQPQGFTPYQQQPVQQQADDNSLALGITQAVAGLAGAGLNILRDDRQASREAQVRQQQREQTLQDRAYCAEHPGAPGCPPGPASTNGAAGPRAAA